MSDDRRSLSYLTYNSEALREACRIHDETDPDCRFVAPRLGDGYGEHDDGAPYDGTGRARPWPLLTGERRHYEPAAGRDPLPLAWAHVEFAKLTISRQLGHPFDRPSAVWRCYQGRSARQP